jgi:hypothetical protein
MADKPRETMEKTVLRKEDGRTLIMYSFKPAGAQAPAKTQGDPAQ